MITDKSTRCPPCSGNCQQGRLCDADMTEPYACDGLDAARGIVWATLICAALWGLIWAIVGAFT
jgi:hypothetical protein